MAAEDPCLPVRRARDGSTWRIGGPAGLVGRFLRHPDLQARPVALGQDATPPGHQAL